jgi:hypothetical protein
MHTERLIAGHEKKRITGRPKRRSQDNNKTDIKIESTGGFMSERE